MDREWNRGRTGSQLANPLCKASPIYPPVTRTHAYIHVRLAREGSSPSSLPRIPLTRDFLASSSSLSPYPYPRPSQPPPIFLVREICDYHVNSSRFIYHLCNFRVTPGFTTHVYSLFLLALCAFRVSPTQWIVTCHDSAHGSQVSTSELHSFRYF